MAKITIIGTGLIGTSLGMALRQSDLRNLQVVGTDYDSRARNGAQKRGAFDKMEARLQPAIEGADVVVLATPVMAMKDLFETIGPYVEEDTVITDVGSSKRVVAEWASEHLPPAVPYVGGHPMAGRETAGPENAAADLFAGKAYCIVPSVHAKEQAVSSIATMAEAIGAKPFFISADEHDSFVAAASHLPFMMSVALMETVSKSANWEDIAQVASSGFRDLSRLASGDVTMHRDISLTNRDHIASWLDSFIRELYEIRNLLKEEPDPDPEAVKELFERASDERARWLAGAITPGSRGQANNWNSLIQPGYGGNAVGHQRHGGPAAVSWRWQQGQGARRGRAEALSDATRRGIGLPAGAASADVSPISRVVP